MKHFYFLIISIIIGINCFSQTVTNFTCNDCSGGSHDLFTELDAGKVVVLCWVMPCSACIPASKTTFNVVTSYQTAYPDRVLFYLIDDYGDTPCSSIDSWGNTNHIISATYSFRFSNPAINMADYGSTGMPKIVVLGGTSHTIFYNVNNTVNSTDLQTAIDSALAATSGVENINSEFFNISLSPIPTVNQTILSVNIKTNSKVKVELYNIVGIKVSEIFNNQLKSGSNKININTSDLNHGIYFIKVSVADKVKTIKLIVSN